jgi:hypothetical protein
METMQKNYHFLHYIWIMLMYHKINLEINIWSKKTSDWKECVRFVPLGLLNKTSISNIGQRISPSHTSFHTIEITDDTNKKEHVMQPSTLEYILQICNASAAVRMPSSTIPTKFQLMYWNRQHSNFERRWNFNYPD